MDTISQMNSDVRSSPAKQRQMTWYPLLDLLYALGLGVLVSTVTPFVLPRSLPMLLTMFLAMPLGMLLGMVSSFPVAIYVGMFETMTCGMWAGMICGMVVAMAPTHKLAAGTMTAALVWAVLAALNHYYRAKRWQIAIAVAPCVSDTTHKQSKPPNIVFWDRLSRSYDIFTCGSDRRLSPEKFEAFSKAEGRVLFVGVGTGQDFAVMPSTKRLVGVDISSGMLQKAAARTVNYLGQADLVQCDIQHAPFRNGTFDTVVCSCVFCSVPDPIAGLREVRRLLKPGGKLIMVEHVLSRNPLLSMMLKLMNPLSKGPDLTRDTVSNLLTAGFERLGHRNIYMDIVKVVWTYR